MEKKFNCPRCKGHLNIGNYIILTAHNQNSKDSGLILFNQEFGNYSVETNTNFIVKEGEKYDFSCPICHEKLAVDLHDNLSRIIMIDTDNKEYEILFSKIAGEQCTYKIIGESIESYGSNHSNYIDFINLCNNK